MSLVILILLTLLMIMSVISYLKVLRECYRKVKIIVVNQRGDFKRNYGDNQNNCTAATTTVEYKQAPGPLPLPILGNLNLIGQYDVPFEGFTALANKFGDAYTLTLGTTRCLVVNNLNLIREVLNQNGKFFGGRPDFLRYHKLFGGDRNNSLALCDWSQLQQKRRNLARKHCSPRDQTSFFTKMSEVGCYEMEEFMDALHKNIKPTEEFNLKPLVMQTCANMFSQYMCSVRFDYMDKEFQKIVRYFDEIFWEINQGYAVDFLPWLLPFYTKHMNKLSTWSTTIRQFILERIVNEREHQLDLDEPERDFTDALLKSLAEDPTVSRDTLIYMLEDFLGGHSAIGNLIMLSLANIVRNPAIGKRIQKEIDDCTENGKRCVSLSDIEEMPFTLATIYEVLRYSSSPIVPHVATEDALIGGYGVTKGTLVIINNYELNTSAKYWNNPKEFDPERFLETIMISQPKLKSSTIDSAIKFTSSSDGQNSNSNNNNNNKYPITRIKKNIPHFLPFSIGKRTCIGQNLVRGFGFIMVANILQEYDVSCKDISAIKTYPACVAVPPDTFHLILNRRIR